MSGLVVRGGGVIGGLCRGVVRGLFLGLCRVVSGVVWVEGGEGRGCSGGGGGGGEEEEVVVEVVRMINVTACLSRRVRVMHLIRVAEHLGASSRRPRHPFPALMAGEPWPCTCVHGPKKASHHNMSCNCEEIRSVLHVRTP